MVLFVVIGALLSEGIQAMINTVIKDVDLVRSGGEALPTSSYISLILRYVVRVLIVVASIGIFDIPTEGPVTIVLHTILFMLSLYVFSFIAEVLIRTLVFTIIMKVRRHKGEDQENE